MPLNIYNKVYFIGGDGYNDNQYNDVWEFDETTNIWSQKKNITNSDLFDSKCKVKYTFTTSNKGYVVTENNKIYEYNPIADNWIFINQIPPSTNFSYSNILFVNETNLYYTAENQDNYGTKHYGMYKINFTNNIVTKCNSTVKTYLGFVFNGYGYCLNHEYSKIINDNYSQIANVYKYNFQNDTWKTVSGFVSDNMSTINKNIQVINNQAFILYSTRNGDNANFLLIYSE